MKIKPIKNERDYRKALKKIDGLMNARPNTPEGHRLDVLVTLVEPWERKHWPIDLPDPVEAILFAMEQCALSRRDLEPFIGSRARVAEVSQSQKTADPVNDSPYTSRIRNSRCVFANDH